MKIIYPPLVEQTFRFFTCQGIETTKDQLYKKMVEDGMLTETGAPTSKAVDQGIIAVYSQCHDTLEEFKKEYPLFVNYDEKEFTQQEGIWYVSQKIMDKLHELIQQNNLGKDEIDQVTTYFEFRNYDDPHGSIAETKGVFHPLYAPYDDSLFEIVNGQVVIPVRMVADIVRRCECGELDVDEAALENFKGLLAQMEE